jgi:hypothetical protein
MVGVFGEGINHQFEVSLGINYFFILLLIRTKNMS